MTAARPGSGGQSPPSESIAMAIMASGVWNPSEHHEMAQRAFLDELIRGDTLAADALKPGAVARAEVAVEGEGDEIG